MKYICFDKDTEKILCNENDLIYIKSLPPTTTTTTTIPMIAIYYGDSSKTRIVEADILSTFFTASGYVGNLSGRSYNFSTGYTYKYWCIPWGYNNPERVINYITNNSTITILAYDSYYRYYQVDPTPIQSITYGIIEINNIWYRIYRTLTKNSTNIEYYVYSF
jgi:hypothetical protein